MKNTMLRFGRYSVLAVVVGLLSVAASSAMAAPVMKKEANVNVSQCYACHQPIQALRTAGKHKSVNCSVCHNGLAMHLKDASKRPSTNNDPATCGACHQDQFSSLYKMDWHMPARRDKSLWTSGIAPEFDKLLLPHGFTKEHATPRAHAFMVFDQFIADRSFGGRFQPIDGWEAYARAGGNFDVWDVLKDFHKGDTKQHAFAPGYAAAVNPVCMSCKSTDQLLDWAYMGDPTVGAKWSRLSNPVEMAQDIHFASNCNFCHDPHSAQPRIVRDALIQALTRPNDPNNVYVVDAQNAKTNPKVAATHATFKVIDMGLRGYDRKIAILNKPDSKLMCAQCHVEYNCNGGTDTRDGSKVTFKDIRSNYFPFVNVWNLANAYKEQHFVDFKHKITGAYLWKAQHPDTETYYGSVHQLAGVDCKDCHMPRMKDKAGKMYTSHWFVSPRNYLKETCLRCHKDWNETQANYVIDSMKNHYYSKVRKAEFWLSRLIDKIEQAKQLGLPDSVMTEARQAHYLAHLNWEWWTATNGGYVHNQEEAIKSLNLSMDISQKEIDKLDKAISETLHRMNSVTAQEVKDQKKM